MAALQLTHSQKGHANSFYLLAKSLSITWGNDPCYWNWTTEQDNSGAIVEVAELVEVCWLEVKGQFDTAKLTPGTSYEVGFEIKMKEGACGWENPVNLKVVLPDGTKIEHPENLKNKPKNKWFEIPAGEFKISKDGMQGFMDIFLVETSAPWKKGLLLNGVVIKPVKKCG